MDWHCWAGLAVHCCMGVAGHSMVKVVVYCCVMVAWYCSVMVAGDCFDWMDRYCWELQGLVNMATSTEVIIIFIIFLPLVCDPAFLRHLAHFLFFYDKGGQPDFFN